jgi:very-short-patch-repair endonuclease
MAFNLRVGATDGQLVTEFRGRDMSGPQLHQLSALSDLISDVGEPVRAFGPTAAALHRFDGYRLRPPFHIVVPRGRNVRRIGHGVHTSEALEPIDCESTLGIPVTAPARTLIDLATSETPPQLTAALDGALRDGLLSEDFLHRRIADLRTSGRYGVPKLLAVIDGGEITRGAQSWLEREYLRLIGSAALPKPSSQRVLGRRGDRLIRVDFHFGGTPVVVETLGYRRHRTSHQMSIDAQRINRLTLNGLIVVQFTYHQVTAEPDYVVATTRAALAPFISLVGSGARPLFV